MEEHAATKLGSSSMSSFLPLLVFQHRHHGQEDVDNEMLMFSVSKQSLHKNLEHAHLAVGNSSMCWSTPQGWILLFRDRDHDDDPAADSSACLWNPSTGDKLPLPDIITDEHEIQIPYDKRCMLSHKDPTHPGCVVVLFSYETPDFWYCHTAAAGDENSSSVGWRRHTYDIGNYASVPKPPKGRKARRGIRPIKRVIPVMASFQGKIYFSKERSNENMCAIDFSPCRTSTTHNRPRFQNLILPWVGLPEGSSSGRKWLVESQDQLFAVTMGYIACNPNNIGAIEVYRMDSSSPTQAACWCRVHDIGDVVFLLEQHSIMAASCSASALGLKANQILFMKNIIDDDADLCIFDMETNTQEITQVHHHDDLILCREPFWIVPPPSTSSLSGQREREGKKGGVLFWVLASLPIFLLFVSLFATMTSTLRKPFCIVPSS